MFFFLHLLFRSGRLRFIWRSPSCTQACSASFSSEHQGCRRMLCSGPMNPRSSPSLYTHIFPLSRITFSSEDHKNADQQPE
jgi:hypothetical protein